MKRSAYAPLQRLRPGEASFSLFPFLAVLLCTMGALITVLVVIARQARLQAEQVPILTKKSPKLEELETARELAQWRTSELKVSREKTEAQVAEMRLQLGAVEDHARQLREQLRHLEDAWRRLQSAQEGGLHERQQAEQELARLHATIDEAKRRLAEAQQAGRRRVSYAVIPYEGPHGTSRRPIYLECRRDAIILQPEGIAFTEADFDGPLGPGNPLDAALRAAREFLLERRQIAGDGSSEPYPLLLVRPSGIAAYYAARAAMKSWTSDFGYELIDEDWHVEFQPPDPALADIVKQVVEVARARQERLAQAAPRHYENRPKYRAAPYRGGLVREDSAGAANQSGTQERQPAGTFGRSLGDLAGSPSAQPARYESVSAGGKPRERVLSPGAEATAEAETQSSPRRQGGPDRPASSIQSTAKAGTPMRPGEWIPQHPTAGKDGAGEAVADDRVHPLAETRGDNWGLRDATNGSVPITRPIRVDLYRDRLVVVPEKGLAGIKVVPLGVRTQDSLDDVIAAVWELMDAWGIAGKGMYWRPILSVYVAPGAEARYDDLTALLDRSGLDVKRK